MISLNVGPSHVSDEVKRDIVDITESGLLSESHRGPAVMDTIKRAVATTRDAMQIPEDYTFLFHPSATACMELILRNCVAKKTFHFVEGAFSKRCADTASRIGLNAARLELDWDRPPPYEKTAIAADTELIALIHCETSTGMTWPDEAFAYMRSRYPDALISVDVTSTFGAVKTNWTQADAWFGSVQKCVGLPAGLGFCFLSPRAMARAAELGDSRHVPGWQDVLHMAERLAIGHTVETPNVLGIALLERQMARRDLEQTDTATRNKAAWIAGRFGEDAFYIRDPAWRSLTSHNLRVENPADWLERALAAGHRLGAGYGPLKTECIRIPTFPAVSMAELREAVEAASP